MGQDIFDLVVVVTLVFYALRGVRNGFVGEVAGIFSLVGGFWAARAWNAQLSPHLQFIADPAWRPLAACVIIFICVMLAIGILARLLQKLLSFSFAGWIDKLGGFLFGLAKGILIWTLIFIVLDKIFHDAQFLRDSRVFPYFSKIIALIRDWLPPEIMARIGI